MNAHKLRNKFFMVCTVKEDGEVEYYRKESR